MTLISLNIEAIALGAYLVRDAFGWRGALVALAGLIVHRDSPALLVVVCCVGVEPGGGERCPHRLECLLVALDDVDVLVKRGDRQVDRAVKLKFVIHKSMPSSQNDLFDVRCPRP